MNTNPEDSGRDDIGFNMETGPVGLAANAAFSNSTPHGGDRARDAAGSAGGYRNAIVSEDWLGFDDIPLLSMPTAHGEKMRQLRTEILIRHGYSNTASLAFAVVSPRPGEGRSRLAAELAVSFAQLGRATLLIDADLRTKKPFSLSGKPARNGLAQALATGATPDFNRVADFSNLSVLEAGEATAFNPTELLSSKRFYRIVSSLRNLFNFVIINTPAFIPNTDALIVSTVVGRVLTLHSAPQDTYADTKHMLNSLARSGSEVIGGVLHKA